MRARVIAWAVRGVSPVLAGAVAWLMAGGRQLAPPDPTTRRLEARLQQSEAARTLAERRLLAVQDHSRRLMRALQRAREENHKLKRETARAPR